MRFLYNLICYILFIYLKLVRRVSVVGKENIPGQGAVIFAPNHTSYMDPLILAPVILPRRLGFLAKKELFFFPLGPFFRAFGTFPVDRKGDATEAIRTSIYILRSSMDLGIFPEGTRNRSENLTLPFKRGVALVAGKADVPVIPVAISGSRGFFRKVTIKFAPPIRPVPSRGSERLRKKDYDRFLHELKKEIESLLKDLRIPEEPSR